MFHESRAGAVYRMVTSFGADGTPSAVVNFPIGVSGVPGSTHWLDTQDDWVNGRYRPMPYERAAVDADARERTTLMP
jgi:penicillin amidase